MSSRILLVEDEPGLVVTISDLLRAEGYQVEVVSDGEMAVAKAGAFDLIILDVMLPKKTGFEVCRELWQKGIDSAILMLTAKTQVADRVMGLKLGADDYLGKPFNPAELLAREALRRRVLKEIASRCAVSSSRRSTSISSAPRFAGRASRSAWRKKRCSFYATWWIIANGW